MFLRAACLFIALTLVSAGDSEDALTVKALKPGRGSYTGDTLSVKCTFDRSQTDLGGVAKLEIFATNAGEESFELVASIAGDSVSYGMSESDVSAEGEIHAEPTKKSKLSVTWASADNGYCKLYKCVVTGGSETEEAYKKVKAKAGHIECKAQKNEGKIVELETQLGECNAALAQKETILNRLQAIDGTKYHLSGVYKGSVYVVPKTGAIFRLQADNEKCKAFGGYLVEFDDDAERQFVGNFTRPQGSAWYFTGANDLDSEGNFVYFHSKKPMTGIKWRANNPDQWGGNEDCVEVNYIGLNDIGCRRRGRYICEIPLM